MDWEIFTLDDERVRLFGQEIANELGRKIISSLREYPKSPNDLARELNQPLTTIVFHMDKLLEARVIKAVGKMAGRRGRKTLYTLSSSAFLVVPVTKEERESYLRRIAGAVPAREILVKSLIVGVLVAIFMAGMPWYLMGPNPPSAAPERAKGVVTSPTSTIEWTPRGEGKGEVPALVYERRSGTEWMRLLMAVLAASILTALIVVIVVTRLGAPPCSEPSP